jgi:predicted glycosyltransferase involved in capsule biosynthesis
MTKEKLVEKIKELLRTDRDLSFLLQLEKKEIEKLLACIRDRVDQVGS